MRLKPHLQTHLSRDSSDRNDPNVHGRAVPNSHENSPFPVSPTRCGRGNGENDFSDKFWFPGANNQGIDALKSKIAGLRIDLDTLRGTRLGVPRLLSILEAAGVKATFFFSVGPDNMGRHLIRMLRPRFFLKMLRTRAASLYGPDILIRGTIWPGPKIGERCADLIRQTASSGHEIGLHAWDHHAWQAGIERMGPAKLRDEIGKGFNALKEILGRAPTCSAAPGWRCTQEAIVAKEDYRFLYNSDCRGYSVFNAAVSCKSLATPQIPVTLPTYDELIGRKGVRPSDYNGKLLSLFRDDGLNVLTVHAEVEGVSRAAMFEDFLLEAKNSGWNFVPLGELLRDYNEITTSKIRRLEIPGREGWVCVQEPAESR